MSAKILLVEDHQEMRNNYQGILSKVGGYQVHAVPDRNSAITEIKAQKFDAVLVDMRLPIVYGGDESHEHGLAVVQAARQHLPDAWIAVITAYGDAQIVRQSMALGANDFLEKPIDAEDLLNRLNREIAPPKIDKASEPFLDWPPPSPPKKIIENPEIIGSTRVMRELRNHIERIARSSSKVILLRGETGTGKELWAEAIHRLSSRSGGPYVRVNCTAITETMAEAALFGVEKDSATGVAQSDGYFRQADGGTLLLDEFGELSQTIQPKLLRALDLGEIQPIGASASKIVDVRVILATNQDLEKATENRGFRQDLLFRAKQATIHIPPLHKHKDDIPDLVNHFIRQYIHSLDDPESFQLREIKHIVWEMLYELDWPGNIRQLKNVVQTALIELAGPVLNPGDICRSLEREAAQRPTSNGTPHCTDDPEKVLFEAWKCLVAEQDYNWNSIIDKVILAALAETDKDSDAAERIGMLPTTLASRKKKLSQGVSQKSSTDN